MPKQILHLSSFCKTIASFDRVKTIATLYGNKIREFIFIDLLVIFFAIHSICSDFICQKRKFINIVSGWHKSYTVLSLVPRTNIIFKDLLSFASDPIILAIILYYYKAIYLSNFYFNLVMCVPCGEKFGVVILMFNFIL